MNKEYFESDSLLREQKYIVKKGYIPQFVIDSIYKWYNDYKNKFVFTSEKGLAYNAYVIKNTSEFNQLDKLFDVLTPRIEAITHSKLIPVYNYGRVYKNGSYMLKHRDRAQCDVSLTMPIAFNNKKPWPIKIKTVTKEEKEINLYVGDALIYRGGELTHWRDENTFNTIQYQHFFHWIDTESECGKYMSNFSLEEIKNARLWPLPFNELKERGLLPLPGNKNV